MDKYIKNDLPLVRSAYEQLIARFPRCRFKMFWEPITEEFFIATDNITLGHTIEYKKAVYKLHGELIKQTYYGVIITCLPFGNTEEEYEINNFSQEVEEGGEQVRSADAGVASSQAAKQGAF